jgi:hypothetical protein
VECEMERPVPGSFATFKTSADQNVVEVWSVDISKVLGKVMSGCLKTCTVSTVCIVFDTPRPPGFSEFWAPHVLDVAKGKEGQARYRRVKGGAPHGRPCNVV